MVCHSYCAGSKRLAAVFSVSTLVAKSLRACVCVCVYSPANGSATTTLLSVFRETAVWWARSSFHVDRLLMNGPRLTVYRTQPIQRRRLWRRRHGSALPDTYKAIPDHFPVSYRLITTVYVYIVYERHYLSKRAGDVASVYRRSLSIFSLSA